MKPLILLCSLLSLALQFSAPASAQLELQVGSQQSAAGTEVEIPIRVEGARQLGPVQFELTFDPDVLETLEVENGSALSGLADSFTPRPGQLNVGTITNAAINGDGELVTVRFLVKGGSGTSTAIEIGNALAFEYGRLTDQLVDTKAGAFTVTGPPWWIPWVAVAALVVTLIALLLLWRRRRRAARQAGGAAPATPSVPLPPTTAPLPSPAASLPAGRASQTPFCTACGTPAAPAARFCGGCGQALEA